MIKQFTTHQIKSVARYFETNKKSKIAVAFFMLLSIFVLGYGIFFLTKHGLESTQDAEDFISQAIPLYLYQIFFAIIGFLIFISTIIFSLFNFLKSDKDRWIIASPKFDSLSWMKYFKAIIESSWPIVVIGLPLILAVREVFDFSIFGLFLAMIALVLFSFLCASLGVVLVLSLSFIFGQKFNLISIVSGIISAIFGLFIWNRVVSVDLTNLFQLEETISPSLDLIKTNFSVFPSYYPAMIIHHLQINDLSQNILSYFGLLFLFCLLSFLAFSLLKVKFLYLWQLFQEGNFEARTKNNQKPFFYFSKPPKSAEDALRKKEILTTIRSPQNLFWFLFLMTLLIIHIGVVNLLESYLKIGESTDIFNAGITPSIQLAVVLFFVASFCLRFVFPSFSQEGDTSWLIGASPIDLKKVFWSKYSFFVFLLSIVGLFSLLSYIIPLSVAFEIALFLSLMVVIGIFTLVTISLSMGVIFINFETNDPQKLSTSPAGISFVLISILYGILGGFLIYYLFLYQNYFLLVLFLLFSVILSIAFISFALKSLKKLEFF